MGVVLKHRVIGSDVQPMRFSLTDVRAEADVILTQARRELDRARTCAKDTLREADVRAEQIERSAGQDGHRIGYEKGFDEGRQAGIEQALTEARRDFAEQTAQLRGCLEGLLNHVEQDRHALLGQAHQELLALAVAIGEKLARQRIEIDEDAVRENVRTAIDLVGGAGAIRVRMHPTDLERLKLLDPQQAEKHFSMDQVSFTEDESVERGGCVLETAGGQIDTQVATQIDTIVRHFAPAMRQRVRAWQNGPECPERTGRRTRSRTRKRTAAKKQ